MSRTAPDSDPVLYFDGVCNLCNGAVQFIIRHEKQGVIKFASLQSPPGMLAKAAVKAQYGQVPDSLILLEGGKYYVASTAALRLAKYLRGGYACLGWLLFIPAFLRNAVYRFIARNRYRWFGKQAECMLPTPELRARFLE